ncbi:hypothetical protein [Pseudomonas fluorescens]
MNSNCQLFLAARDFLLIQRTGCQTFSLQGNGGLDFSTIIKLFRGEA